MVSAQKQSRKSLRGAIVLAFVSAVIQSCMPPQSYRSAPVPPSVTRSPQSIPQTTTPAPETARRPLPQEAKIREQDLKKGSPIPPILKDTSKETRGFENRVPTEPPGSVLRDDSSLLAKITPATPPQRAASLRLTEEGRKLLEAGDPNRALSRLEKTIVIDSTNPYGYFYLAKTHYRLGRYKESLNFLDVAESRLSGEPFWLAEVYALRGENLRALGMTERAEANYNRALSLNSGNRTATEALSRLQTETQAVSH